MKILFISYGCGGSEVINEVIKVLDINKYEMSVIAVSKMAFSKIDNAILVNKKDALKFINKEIDLVVSERSNGIAFQKNVTRKCKKLGIKNLVLLDISTGKKGEYIENFDLLPDFITSISKNSHMELIEMGFSEYQIYKLGNPAYMRLRDINYNRSFTKKPKVLFLSQGGDGNFDHELLVSTLYSFIDNAKLYFDDLILDIKLHPMEESYRKRWERAIDEFGWSAKLLNIGADVDFLMTHISEYDLLYGIGSSLQIQGQMLGIPTIFGTDNIDISLSLYREEQFPISETQYPYYESNEKKIVAMFDEIAKNIEKN